MPSVTATATSGADIASDRARIADVPHGAAPSGGTAMHRSGVLGLVPVLVCLVALTACGSSTQEPEGAEPVEPPTTAASTTAATTTVAPTTTAPPATAPAATGATAMCVQGQWLLDDPTTTALHQTLLPGFPVSVSGTQQLTFEGDTVEHYTNEVLLFELPGTSLSTAYDTRSAGSFGLDSDSSAGDIITMDYLTVEGGFGPIEGTVTDNENNPLSVLVETPGFELPAIAGGPITCDGDTMTIVVTSGIASAPATFTRIG